MEKPIGGLNMALSSDNLTGFILVVLSSAFIGASFIIKKGLKRAAAASGVRAGEFYKLYTKQMRYAIHNKCDMRMLHMKLAKP